MDSNGRRHLRKVARTRDESHQDKKFRVALSQADADKVEANRKADQVKEQKASERREILQAFKPILSLPELKKMTVDGDRASRIRQQLIWHRDIGNDVNLKGIHKMNKEVAWANMVCAVRRHCNGTSSMKGMQLMYFFIVD
jgi:multidrug resistance efflux pump